MAIFLGGLTSCQTRPVIIYPEIAIPVVQDAPVMPEIIFFDIDQDTIGLTSIDALELGYYLLDMQTHIEILESYIQYFVHELEYISTMRED